MCLSCGWKPEGEGMMDNPIFKYMQNAFDIASADLKDGEELPNEYEEQELAAFGYIGPAFIYSLIKRRDSDLVKYHAKQSAMLLLAHMLTDAVCVLPFVGTPVKKMGKAVLIVLAFLGARNAYFGKKEPVPVIGKIIPQLLGDVL